jgi:hypothetical protein
MIDEVSAVHEFHLLNQTGLEQLVRATSRIQLSWQHLFFADEVEMPPSQYLASRQT